MAASKSPKKAKSKKTKETGAESKKLSALAAAAKVLAETAQPMSCKEMIEAMAQKGYWSSPDGKTPASTLYSGILKEISTKGKESRFRKTDRGRFART
jgi:HB1, ASXL, restriction endonuclease HTH domain